MSLGASLGGSFVRHASGLWMLGDNAKDSSGNGNDGAVVGGVTFGQAGPFSGVNAALFNGTTGEVNVPNATSLNVGTGPFAPGYWFNFTAAQNSPTFGKLDPGYAGPLWLSYAGSPTITGQPGFDMTPDGYGNFFSAVTTANFNDGKWHLFVPIIDRVNPIQFTVDGVVVPMTDRGSTDLIGAGWNLNNTQPLLLGTDLAGDFYNGSLAMAFLAPYAMGQPEAARLYRHGIRGV